MTKSRELLNPHQAVKMLVSTLNCKSLNRERVHLDRVQEATGQILSNLDGKQPGKHRRIVVNSRDVILSGAETALAIIQTWKPAEVDLLRVRGKRAKRIVAKTIRDEIAAQLERLKT